MERENDEGIVICGPVWTSIMQGSKILKCHRCGKDCSCSPVGMKLINEEGAHPYCPTCGIDRLKEMEKEGGTIDIVDPTEAINLAEEFLKSQENN